LRIEKRAGRRPSGALRRLGPCSRADEMSEEEKKKTQADQPDRLADLLHIGLEADLQGPLHPDEQKESLLRARLAGTLPLEKEALDVLPIVVGQLLPLGGGSLGRALLDADTPLEVLQKIKDHGKRLALAGKSEAEHAAATTVYFAAIASAILFHGHRITTYSYGALAEHFGRLIDKRWMDPKLARHLAKARRKCKRKAK